MLAGGSAPDATLERRLRASFNEAQMVELTYAMACVIGYSKQLIALGLEPETMDLTVVPVPT